MDRNKLNGRRKCIVFLVKMSISVVIGTRADVDLDSSSNHQFILFLMATLTAVSSLKFSLRFTSVLSPTSDPLLLKS